MTTVPVYGDVKPHDDRTHALGPESNFNESMYFNFFDNRQRLGGFLRIGNRANEGYAEVTLCLYLPGGEALFNYKRPQITTNDSFDAGGMRFEVVEPFVRMRTTYDGSAVFLADPSQMGDPGQAFRENPHKRITLGLEHEAEGPIYGSAGAGRETGDPEKEFAKAHYEQHMRVSGRLTVDDETFAVDAFGLRDHSWGPRYWQAIKSYRWLTCAFGHGFGIMVSEIRPAEDVRQQAGVVIRDGKLDRITSVEIESRYRPGTDQHSGMTARVGLAGGETLALEGEVKGYIPLRNRRNGLLTRIGEGMTEYRCEGHTALGISEYLDQAE